MKVLRNFITLVFTYSLTCLLTHSLLAGPGTTGAQFLKINPSARASGMAGAFSGISDDIFALYSNPAGLAQLEKAELATTFLQYFADINFGFIGYTSNVRNFGVMAFGYTYLLVDKIEKRDASENRLDDFNAKDTSVTIAYGRKDAAPSVLEDLSVGASLKLIGSEIDQVNAYTVALDLGAMYSPVEKLNTSFAIQNIGNGISFRDATDKLPLNFKLGAAYRVSERLNIGTEIDEYVFDNKFYAAIGTEYWAAQQFALRLGYRFGYDTSNLGSNVGLSAGIGFRIWSLGLDYAFVPFGDLGDTHRITFMAKF